MDTLAGDALGVGSVPANELRQVKQLLWTVIAEKLNPAEVDEVSPRGTFLSPSPRVSTPFSSRSPSPSPSPRFAARWVRAP